MACFHVAKRHWSDAVFLCALALFVRALSDRDQVFTGLIRLPSFADHRREAAAPDSSSNVRVGGHVGAGLPMICLIRSITYWVFRGGKLTPKRGYALMRRPADWATQQAGFT